MNGLGGFTGNDFVQLVAAGAVAYAFAMYQKNAGLSAVRGETMASVAEQIRTMFKRLDKLEETQDDHADEQADIREAVILQGSHIETAVGAINQIAQRLEVWLGESSRARVSPIGLATRRLSPSKRVTKGRGARRSRRRG